MAGDPATGPAEKGPLNPDPSTLAADHVKSEARMLGADAVGIAQAAPVESRDLFMSWLANGFEGEMDYMRKYSDLRYNPAALLPGAQSVVVVGLNYSPAAIDREAQAGPFKVAKYAWGEDYHRVLRRLLKRLRSRLQQGAPALRGRICVDTAPFPDKYWAAQAGLGWQGKHTNLVSRDFGSWLLLGSLVIDYGVDRYDQPHQDFCGSCTACLSACPTSAFPAAYQLDATRCISYWTIESKASNVPEEIAAGLDGWMFGCDICLDVCPWNKFETDHSTVEFERSDAVQTFETGGVPDLAAEEFVRVVAGTPLGRPGLQGILRNQRAAEKRDQSSTTIPGDHT